MERENGEVSFRSDFSGYIGIAPWSSEDPNGQDNFLYQLKNQGLIDHMTVSFYVSDKNRADKSTIKFGSYDEIALHPDHKLRLLRTSSRSTWDLDANEIKLGKTSVAEHSLIRFEP